MRRKTAIRLSYLLILFFFIFGSTGCGEQGCDSGRPGMIKLAWDPSREPDLAGYKVYYGTAPGTYGPPIDVGNVTAYTLTGLTKGKEYYVAITSYTTSNRESTFSREVHAVAK